MRLDLSGLAQSLPNTQDLYISIGVFDGVHLGHRAVLGQMQAEALRVGGDPTNLRQIVISMDPHPVQHFRAAEFQGLLNSLAQRRYLLETTGVDAVYVLDFAKVARETPEAMLQVLLSRAERTHWFVGTDFAFGKDRAGNLAWLRQQDRVRVHEVATFYQEGKSPRSQVIRQCIQSGQMKEAARLLGYQYTVCSAKLNGDQIGRTIGFPTLNQGIESYVLPKVGVYYTQVAVQGQVYLAMSYVGRRTFQVREEAQIETHLLDFDGDLPEGSYALSFLKFIRAEKTFDNLEDLKQALYNDKKAVRILSQKEPLLALSKQLLLLRPAT